MIKFFLSVVLVLFFIDQHSDAQQAAEYQRAADLAENAAKQYDAKGCAASAAYCRRIRDWNLCMVKNLGGQSCGLQPSFGDAPRCEDGNSGGSVTGSTIKSDPVSDMQTRLQQSQQQTDNAIDAMGNLIWGFIQSGKVKKENTSAGIVRSFAQSLYNTKKDMRFYDDLQCDKCNGSGKLVYTTSGILYGQSHPCDQCNGIGRLKKPKAEFDINNSHSEAFNSFVKAMISYVYAKTPLFTLYPEHYKGSAEFRTNLFIGGHNDDLVVKILRSFSFLDKKGRYDVDTYTYTSLYETVVFPLETIQSFEIVPAQTKFVDGSRYISNEHLVMVCNTGERLEFSTTYNTGAKDALNNLLAAVKSDAEARRKQAEKKVVDPMMIVKLREDYADVVIANQKSDLVTYGYVGKIKKIKSVSYTVEESSYTGKPDLKELYTSVTYYNSKGNLTKEESNLTGDKVKTKIYEYNKKDAPILVYNLEDASIWRQYEYIKLPGGGYQKTETEEDDYSSTTKFFRNNVETEAILVFKKGGSPTSHYKFQYDAKGNLVSSTQYSGDTLKRTTKNEYRNGKIVKQENYDTEGVLKQSNIFRYDANNQLTEQTTIDEAKNVQKTAYEKKDAKGNFQVLKIYEDGKQKYMLVLSFEYY